MLLTHQPDLPMMLSRREIQVPLPLPFPSSACVYVFATSRTRSIFLFIQRIPPCWRCRPVVSFQHPHSFLPFFPRTLPVLTRRLTLASQRPAYLSTRRRTHIHTHVGRYATLRLVEKRKKRLHVTDRVAQPKYSPRIPVSVGGHHPGKP